MRYDFTILMAIKKAKEGLVNRCGQLLALSKLIVSPFTFFKLHQLTSDSRIPLNPLACQKNKRGIEI